MVGVLEVEYIKGNEKLDTRALGAAHDELYGQISYFADAIMEHVEMKSNLKAEYVTSEYEKYLKEYPKLEAFVFSYKGDGEPKLPPTIRLNTDDFGPVTVKFVQFVPIKELEVGPGVGAAAGPAGAAAAAVGPIGAGAGPALPPIAPPQAVAAAAAGDSDDEDEDLESGKSTPRGDVEMAGGKKKRRSKTKKHRRHAKKRGTRRS